MIENYENMKVWK